MGLDNPRSIQVALQLLPYHEEPLIGPITQLIRSPEETMAEGGSCVSHSRLAGALLTAAGIPARAVGLGGDPPSHVAVMYWDGNEWQWLETTIRAFKDEHPVTAAARLGMAPIGMKKLSGFGSVANNLDPSRDVEAREVLLAVWDSVTDLPKTPFALQAVQAQARLETQYGRGWKAKPGVPGSEQMANSNNWGSVQCTQTGYPCQPGCAPYGDSHQDGTKYEQCFKVYPTPEAGAADFLRHMTVVRPDTKAALAAGEAWEDVSRALYFESYYGGWCPNAIAAWKPQGIIANQYSRYGSKKPQTVDQETAGKACDEEAIARHAEKLFVSAEAIARNLDEPLALPFESSGKNWLLAGAAAVGGAALIFRKRIAKWFK